MVIYSTFIIQMMVHIFVTSPRRMVLEIGNRFRALKRILLCKR